MIASYWVLTAAHCIPPALPVSNLRLVLGEHNRKEKGEEELARIVVPVSRIILHPQFNASVYFGNDIGLLKLSVQG